MTVEQRQKLKDARTSLMYAAEYLAPSIILVKAREFRKVQWDIAEQNLIEAKKAYEELNQQINR